MFSLDPWYRGPFARGRAVHAHHECHSLPSKRPAHKNNPNCAFKGLRKWITDRVRYSGKKKRDPRKEKKSMY